ncbi:hypothetical protein BGZ60DRAFT_569680 [Tricladium varicosporioides]|nr:hypothetical protein BGZ60DRAFT_569680 [Hymenoscyphus varicosporioides]
MSDATPKHENHDFNILYNELPHFPSNNSQLLTVTPIAQNGPSTIETTISTGQTGTDSLTGPRVLPEYVGIPAESNQNNTEMSRNPVSSEPQDYQQLSDGQNAPLNMLKHEADSPTQTSSTTGIIFKPKTTDPLNTSIATAATTIPTPSPSSTYFSN